MEKPQKALLNSEVFGNQKNSINMYKSISKSEKMITIDTRSVGS